MKTGLIYLRKCKKIIKDFINKIYRHLIISFLLFNLFLNIAVSQTYTSVASSEYEARLIPDTPEIATLGQFGSEPIDKYTGTANIQIPLYEIELDGLKIPLTASYNTGGITVSQEATWLGLGWNLNAGANITNEINDFEDTKNLHAQGQPLGYIFSEDYLTRSPHPSYVLEITDDNETELVSFNQNGFPVDTEPDIFTANLFGKSVKFVLKKLVPGNTIIEVSSINYPNIKVYYNTVNEQFSILDAKGFTYIFGEIEYATPSKSYSSGYTEFFQEEDLIKKIGYESQNIHDIEQDKISWQLSKIISPYNNELVFNYDRGIHMTYPSVSDQLAYGCNRLHLIDNESSVPYVFTFGGGIDFTFDGGIERTAHIYTFENVYLKSITGDFGAIEFNLIDRLDLFSKDALNANRIGDDYRYPFKPFSSLPPKRVNSVVIKDNNNIPIRNISFTQSYFNDDKISDIKKEKYLRLKLNSISIGDKTYSFNYILPNNLPPKNSRGIDFWGYYNGTDNEELIPPYGRFNISWNPDLLGYEYYTKYNGKANRKSDYNFGKIGLLEEVIYPTGGSTKYIYEGNRVTIKKPALFYPDYSVVGTFKNSNINNSIDYAWNYQYLKMTNDPTYSFLDYNGCQIKSESIKTNFIVTGDLCNGQPNVKINSTIACATGDCYHTPSPSGKAVWIENLDNSEITILRTHSSNSSDYGTKEHILSLPAGSYALRSFTWSDHDPYTGTKVATVMSSGIVWNNVLNVLLAKEYEEFDVGGLRLAAILDKDKNNQIVTKRQFDYNFINGDGNESSSGLLMNQLIYHSKNNGFFEYTPEHYYDNTINLHSESIMRSRNSASGNHVGYSKVIETMVSINDASTNGKNVSNFINIPNDYISRNIGTTPAWVGATEQTSYGDVYLLNMLPKSYSYKNGNIIENRIYDTSDNLLKTTTYGYNEFNSPSYIEDEAYAHISYQLFVIPDPCYTSICGFFPVLPYYKEIKFEDMRDNYFSATSQIINQINLSNGSISTTEKYFYNNRFTLSSMENHLSEGVVQTSKFYYPHDFPSEPFMTNLISANRVNQRMKLETYIGDVHNLPGTNLQTVHTKYTNTTTDNFLVLPNEVVTYIGGNVEGNHRVIYERYDTKGNLLQYRRNVNDMPITFVWSYNKQYPVAKIENATFQQVASALGISETALMNFDISSLSTLNVLRTRLQNAMIYTYTYDPLVGITSQTDPNEHITKYVYDELGRLVQIKDVDVDNLEENIINQIEYKYKNQ